MHIWFAAQIPAESHGGVGRSIRELGAGLRQRGHHVVTIHAGALTRRNYLLFALKVLACLVRAAPDPPDWIIARSTDGVLCSLWVKAWGLKTRMVLHNHGWEEHVFLIEQRLPRRLVTFPTTWKARLVRFTLLRESLRRCDFCMSGTVDEVRYLSQRYRRFSSRYAYVPNGVTPPPSRFWDGSGAEPHNFLSIGGFTWKKNQEYTLALFAQMRTRIPNARLYLVGTGIRDTERLPAHREEDEDAIVNVATEHFDRMATWYRTCPFLIAASRFEGGHAFSILEAMSYGAVVFVSAIPSSMEIVRDGLNGFVITGVDASADAERVVDALSDARRLALVRERAYGSARRNAWPRQVSRLERLLCTPL